jgi:RNA polymerase sigma-70 factor (ECF subfamily)
MDEASLIRQAQAGDIRAFNTLVRTYQGLAYNVAYRLVGDPDTAADMTQEAMVHAYQSLHTFRGVSFRAWLMRITTNLCYDHLRYTRRRPAMSLQEIVPDAEMDESELSVLVVAETPEDSVLRDDFANVVAAGLARLPDNQRLALTLVDIQGFSYEEAAATLGDELGTIKSRLSRARARLRDYLSTELGLARAA